jgi:DNA-binding CsgD family transcriptional regulator
MTKRGPLLPPIWWVTIEAPTAGASNQPLSNELFPDAKRESLATALKIMMKGIAPSAILLEGTPGKAMQSAMAQIHEIRPSLPVFVISQWPNVSEMRAWFSRYFMEIARPSAPNLGENTNRHRLSTRELHILRFMVKGLIKKEIAEQLSISYHTVDNHERSIFRKLNVHTRSAAVAKALIDRIC